MRPKKESNSSVEPTVRRKRSLVDRLLLLAIIILFLMGFYFLLKPYYIKWQRSRLTHAILDQLDRGETKQTIPFDPKAYRLQRPEYDFYEVLDNGEVRHSRGTREPSAELSYLTPLGRLMIPRFDLNTPLLKEFDWDAMFYGACLWPDGAEPGAEGNAVLFLHRSENTDYDFMDADQMETGDAFSVEYDGQRLNFVVEEVSVIEPEQLLSELMDKHQDGVHVTLVTCTPPHVFSHRILITGSLRSSAPLLQD